MTYTKNFLLCFHFCTSNLKSLQLKAAVDSWNAIVTDVRNKIAFLRVSHQVFRVNWLNGVDGIHLKKKSNIKNNWKKSYEKPGGGLVRKSYLTLVTSWTVACQLLCPWDSPGKNTRVVCHFLLQGIFWTQKSNLGLLHCRQILYWLNYEGSPRQCIKKQRHYFANKDPYSQSYDFSSSLVRMWELGHKEG